MKRRDMVFIYILFFILSLSIANGQQAEIRILHINDLHGFVEPHRSLGSNELYGGITFLAGKVEQLRQEKPTLLLSAGDMIQGHNWANLFQGASVIELMNIMRFDAMVLGNHEFDFGREALKQRISESTFPVLGANVDGLDGIQAYVIKEIKGIKLAIIGLTTEDTPASTHPENVVGLKFLSPIETVKNYIKELTKRVDLVIILSHLGHNVDRILAEGVKGIDAIVGGHTHTKILRPVEIGNTLIVQAWEHGKALGVLDLTIKDGKIIQFEGRLEEVKPGIGEENKAVLEIVKKYNEKASAVLNETIGEAEVDLDGERRNVRRRETNLGNLIADIVRNVSGADAAIINGGGIRASIRKGEVRVRDIYTVLPFDNYIVAIKLTGRQIWEALEYGLSMVEEEEGRFPQVSGISLKYSLSAKKGSRIKEMMISGKPIDLDKEYIVATNDFIAAGGDGYKAFGEALRASRDFSINGGMMKGEKVVYSDSGRWLRDVVAEYIREKRKVAPTVEGRIIEIP